MTLAAIETEGLLELLIAAPVAAVVVAITWALALRGFAKSAEAGRAGHSGVAIGYGVLAVVATLAFTAAVAFGITVIVTKD